MNYEEMLK